MAKDPAFLFYYQDFLVGTDHMTNEQVGMYIKALCHQANRGSIRPDHLKKICVTRENHMIIMEKFKTIPGGDFINERLAEETLRRQHYSESRRKNREGKNICKTHETHMETETENETINEIIDLFNKICGTHFRHTKANQKFISGRLADGHSKEDCIKVIKRKYAQWKGDPEMAKYIRIETMFRPSKFESYLNEKDPIKKSDEEAKKTDEYLNSLKK